jgi:septal ring factor EnvC (AmiA/AmiB activator)
MTNHRVNPACPPRMTRCRQPVMRHVGADSNAYHHQQNGGLLMFTQPPEDNDYATGTFCERTAEVIKSLKQEIEMKEREINSQRDHLGELQKQPSQDANQIEEMKNEIQALEDELEMDREQLSVLEEEYNAECSPSP